MNKTKKQSRRSLKTHFDAIVHFISKMDEEMISVLLDSNLTYQSFPKHIFVRKLGDLFFDLKKLGDTKFVAQTNHIELPSGGIYGITFEGNVTSMYVEIVFEVDENGFVQDIYEVESEISDQNKSTKQRVYIDQFYEWDDANFESDLPDEDIDF